MENQWGQNRGQKNLNGDRTPLMGTKESEEARMSLVGWLIGILLAPVFITIGLGVLVITGLFEGEEGGE